MKSLWVYEGIPSAVSNVSLLLRCVQVEAVLVQVLFQTLHYCCAIVALCRAIVALCRAIVALLFHYVALLMRYSCAMLRYCCAMSRYCCAIVALCCAIVALLLRYVVLLLCYVALLLRYFARLLCHPPKQCGALRPKKAPGGRHITKMPKRIWHLFGDGEKYTFSLGSQCVV